MPTSTGNLLHSCLLPFLERLQPVVHEWPRWTDDEIRSVTAPTFLVIGDRDFVRLDHAAEMLDLFPDCRVAVLPDTKHTEIMQRSEHLRALVASFLDEPTRAPFRNETRTRRLQHPGFGRLEETPRWFCRSSGNLLW